MINAPSMVLIITVAMPMRRGACMVVEGVAALLLTAVAAAAVATV